MPRAVILTALPVEYMAVRTHLTDLQEEMHPQGTIYERGKFIANGQEWEVGIVEVGAGNAGAAVEAERAIAYFQPEILLFVGIAGGIKDVAIGDVVAATKVYGYESGKVGEQFFTRPALGQSAYALVQRAKAEARKEEWLQRLSNLPSAQPHVFVAPIAAGEKVLASKQSDIFQFLRASYNDAVAVDMESFGFLSAAFAYPEIKAIVIRGISDLIDGKNDNSVESEEIRQEKASLHASAFAFEILAKYQTNETGATQQFRGVVPCSITSNELLAGIGKREVVVSNESSRFTDERHKRIDHAQTLINQGQFNEAIQYIENLKAEFWYKVDNSLKYRILANLGIANLGLDEVNRAAAKFLEALQYNPEDDRAIAYAAMGYLFQEDYARAEKSIEKALEKNPANTLAYSLLVRVIHVTDPIESVVERIPPAYRNSLDVLVALGEAALRRGRCDKAEEWWQTALKSCDDSSMDRVKAALGAALLKPITHYYPLIAVGQLLETQKDSLERAVSLFTDVLGGDYVSPKNLSRLKFNTLTNRSAALRLLSRHDEAIRDLEIARQKEPDNPYLIKQRVLLAHEKGNEEEACRYAKQILSLPETPEAFLLVASSLMARNLDREAEDILNQFLKIDSHKHLKQEANHLKFNLFLNRGDRKKAESILHEVSSEDQESVFTLIDRIRWYKYIGSEESISALIGRAKTLLFSNTSIQAQVYFADLLYSLSYYRDASEIYEQFVDKTLNSKLSQKLLQSYYLAGNYKDALSLCQQLLDKYGSLETVSEMASCIYEYIGDLDTARQICEDYINTFPDDVRMKLRLAGINYATKEYRKLDRFLNSKPSTKSLILEDIKILARLHKVRGRIDEFLETIYEMRYRFYNDTQVHVLYQTSYMLEAKSKPSIQSFDVVEDGCGVLVSNEYGNEQWYILEDRLDASLARCELNSSQPLYKALIGKSLGEEVIQAEDTFGRNALKILAITDKYFAASKQSFSVLENQPDLKGFRMVDIPMDGDKISSEWLHQFLEGIQKLQDRFNTLKSEYISGKFPLGTVAILQHRNPIELWKTLALGSSPFIHAWSNFKNEKFEDALIALQKGGLVVIDPISLITLHYLDVADKVVKILGEFGIAQSSIDLFQALIEDAQGLQCKGFMTLGVENGQTIKQEITPEQVSHQKKVYEKIVDWIKENCLILPCHRALDIYRDERSKLSETIGTAFIDTVLIAGEPGRILYSDDQWLRWYARADSSTPGVWTQVVLKYCFIQQNLNESLYQKTTLELVMRGYTYTIIDADILMEAARLYEWKVNPIYTSALRALANKAIILQYTVSVVADFLRQLYLEVLITNAQVINPRDALVFELLKILTKECSITAFIKILKQSIRQKFQVIPLQEKEVLAAINVWVESQDVLT
ncbi:hypothetical protein IQ249_15545 [Lusitaniella coriacea LEGE 07157]|uniref:Nucleoside phosphorylase domain-containing protein n=1 Tax=Lusitaniella coriacea LEGE 07157 TaxID=945747 RepID=A0A8J7IVJ5_9CYAN|nr:hypothetical protein [Lusitaniella coriacea]MBE9117313.1 hypothetical protein [Lusitaniella coriacea LEGE 07157]